MERSGKTNQKTSGAKHHKARSATEVVRGSSPNDEMETMFLSVAELLLSAGADEEDESKGCFLLWMDVVALAAVNRSCRRELMDRQNSLLLPLLSCLEKLAGTNIHSCCGKVHAPRSVRKCTCAEDGIVEEPHCRHPDSMARFGRKQDPRFKGNHDTLSASEKFAVVVQFLELVIDSQRQLFNFSDLANPDNLPVHIGRVENWSFGFDFELHDEHKDDFPNRSAFAFNLVLLKLAICHLQFQPYHCIKAFLGEGGIESTGSSLHEPHFKAMAEGVQSLLPFSDVELIKCIRLALHPTPSVLELLGPALVPEVVLCAPMFDMVAN